MKSFKKIVKNKICLPHFPFFFFSIINLLFIIRILFLSKKNSKECVKEEGQILASSYEQKLRKVIYIAIHSFCFYCLKSYFRLQPSFEKGNLSSDRGKLFFVLNF